MVKGFTLATASGGRISVGDSTARLIQVMGRPEREYVIPETGGRYLVYETVHLVVVEREDHTVNLFMLDGRHKKLEPPF